MTTKADIRAALRSYWPHSGWTDDALRTWAGDLHGYGSLAIDAIRRAAKTDEWPKLARIREVADSLRPRPTFGQTEGGARYADIDARIAATRARILAMMDAERDALRERVLSRHDLDTLTRARLLSRPMLDKDGNVNGLWRACAEGSLT